MSDYELPPFPRGKLKIRRINPGPDGTFERSPVETPDAWWDSVMQECAPTPPPKPEPSFAERNRLLLDGSDHLWWSRSDYDLHLHVIELVAGQMHEVRAACLTMEGAQTVEAWLNRNRPNGKFGVFHVPTVEKIPGLFANVEVWTRDDIHIDFRFAKTNSRETASLLFRVATTAYPNRIVRARHGINTLEASFPNRK